LPDRAELLANGALRKTQMSRRFPKLLVTSEFPPNASGGGPAVVRQMLKDWPAQSLSWWSCIPDRHGKFGREIASNFVATIPEKLYPRNRLRRPKAFVLEHGWSGWAASHLRATIRTCKPDAIWAIPHQWSILPLASALPCGTPYHVSIHDYPDAHHSAKRIGAKTTGRLVHLVEKLYREANSRDAISDEMAADLQERTGKPTNQILHAGLERADFDFLKQKGPSSQSTTKIAYAGTIIAKESFTLFVEGLARIRQRLRKPVELHFFGAHSYAREPWFDRAWMTQVGDLEAEELRTVLQTFDWGFVPMELDDENAAYNRYSLPTKIVSYLAAGLGVITMGHTKSTVARLGQEYSLGIAIDETRLSQIDDLLLQGLSEENIWARYGDAIRRCAEQKFDAVAMKADLYARLGVDQG